MPNLSNASIVTIERQRGKRGPAKRTKLSAAQRSMIDALVTRRPDETLADIAVRMGVHPRTLHRNMKEDIFRIEYQLRLHSEFYSARGKVAQALILGACTPGPGQAAMQKIFWEMTGDLIARFEFSGPNGGPIQVESSGESDLSRLSPETKALLIRDLKAAGVRGDEPIDLEQLGMGENMNKTSNDIKVIGSGSTKVENG